MTSPAPALNPGLDLNPARERVWQAALILGLALLVFVLFILSLAVGREPLSLFTAAAELLGEKDTPLALVLREIRLPRALLGAFVGAALGLAGAALQGMLRNPLAEPGIIGVSGAAAFGAVVVFYSGLSASFLLALPLGGMTGALVSVALLYALSARDSSVLTLVLAGVAVNALAGALTALALNLAPSPYAATEIAFWLLGSLADRSLGEAALSIPFIVIGGVLLLSCARGLDALSLGEDTAHSLGVDLRALRARLVLGTALSVGAAVSVTGGIAFVGLVVPHLLRPLVGFEPGRLLAVSALGGAALTLAADLAVRLVPTATELRIGVATALLGAPFFLYLVLRTRREMR
jgi:iron complex transport system permease protein